MKFHWSFGLNEVGNKIQTLSEYLQVSQVELRCKDNVVLVTKSVWN